MFSAHPLNSGLLNAVFNILQALNVAICYHRHLQNVDCFVGCDDLEGEENAPSQHP